MPPRKNLTFLKKLLKTHLTREEKGSIIVEPFGAGSERKRKEERAAKESEKNLKNF